MIEVEEIRGLIADMSTDLTPKDKRQIVAVLLKICDKLDEHEHAVDVLSEWRETHGC